MFMPWLQNLQTEVTSANGLASSDVTFDDVSSLAGQVGRRFFELNNQDCSDLKNTLVAMEDRKPGRVRLSDFYNKSRFSKFAFTEKIDYLRSLGALDETKRNQSLGHCYKLRHIDAPVLEGIQFVHGVLPKRV